MYSQRQLFLNHLAQTTGNPLMIEVADAKGMYIRDTNGKKYLDLISGISVSNLGHCHPAVVKSVTEQINKYAHTMVFGEFVQSPQTQLARQLTDLLPEPLNSVYFVNSGSEAVEGALKLAKRVTGRFQTVSFHHAYHGSTQGALTIMGSEEFKTAFRPLLPGNQILQPNDFTGLEKINRKTACVIIEPVQGEAGVRPVDKDYMLALRKKCNETGALLIFDEVQTGFGRTGTFFAMAQFNVVPDIVVFAKGMGGGLPLGAFVSSREMMHRLSYHPILGHISTFGGNPVSCAAGLSVIETLVSEKHLIQSVAEKEKRFVDLLKHPAIKEVRHFGLLLAIEFEDYGFNKKVIDRCIENGLITDWFLFADNSLRIAPPLIITTEEVESACKIILKSIDEVAKHSA
jgi:acetylornithine/succinyldiaminopimelate/putrescine aminotransferase